MKYFENLCFFGCCLSFLLIVGCFSEDLQRDETKDPVKNMLNENYKENKPTNEKQASLDESELYQEISPTITMRDRQQAIKFLEKENIFEKTGINKQLQNENHNVESYNIQRMKGQLKVKEESAGAGIVTIIIIAILAGGVFFIYKFWKNRKQKYSENGQRRNEKLRFIPRVSIPSDAVFSESSSGLNGLFSKKKSGKQFHTSTRIFSPSNKNAPTLKLEEEVHHSTAINENIFTNIDDSPRSSGEQSPPSSVRETPKGINFNIEFSMLEHDSRSKSARDHD